MPDSLVRQWRQAGGTTKVIHQAEIYPAVVGVKLWSAMLAERCVILFIDNEAARGALIKGSTTSAASAALVGEFWDHIARLGAHVWIERVPSHANIADAPSRNSWRWLKDEGFDRVATDCLKEFEMGAESC